jgi:hypothetical protein
LFLAWYLGAVSKPPPIEPPTPENVHLYRDAVLAWRLAERNERHKTFAEGDVDLF